MKISRTSDDGSGIIDLLLNIVFHRIWKKYAKGFSKVFQFR